MWVFTWFRKREKASLYGTLRIHKPWGKYLNKYWQSIRAPCRNFFPSMQHIILLCFLTFSLSSNYKIIYFFSSSSTSIMFQNNLFCFEKQFFIDVTYFCCYSFWPQFYPLSLSSVLKPIVILLGFIITVLIIDYTILKINF